MLDTKEDLIKNSDGFSSFISVRVFGRTLMALTRHGLV